MTTIIADAEKATVWAIHKAPHVYGKVQMKVMRRYLQNLHIKYLNLNEEY